jgi:hypothetical protein
MDRASPRVLVVAMLTTGALACRRPRLQPAPDPVGAAEQTTPGAVTPALPDRIGRFVAGAVTWQGGASRRIYTMGQVQIAVTLARFPMTAEEYGLWVRTSTAGYPQATLDLPPEAGNGFYQCREGTEGSSASCDLLVQLRSGAHLEIRGGGTSSRADVDAIARGLPLRGWSRAAVDDRTSGGPDDGG